MVKAAPTAEAACAVIAWWDNWEDDGSLLRAVRRIRRARLADGGRRSAARARDARWFERRRDVNGTYTRAERAHVERVKALACSVCDAPGPSEAHHVQQGLHYAALTGHRPKE